MDLRIKTTALTVPEDDRWLGNDSNTSTNGINTIQLDGASLVGVYTDGVIKSGTILAQDATTKRYYVFNSAGTNGKEIAKYLLYRTVFIDPADPNDTPAAGLWRGQVKTAFLPRTNVQTGGPHADAITALKHVRFS